MHPACRPVQELLIECEVRRQRRSGPGGQHRNKVETGIFLRHVPTNIEAAATEQRSQEANRKTALQRLRIRLATEFRQAVVFDSAPSERWKIRCLGGILRVSPHHADFPALLAEALDQLHARHYDFVAAARHFGCSRSQLLKLIKLETAAFAAINRHRRSVNLPPLR